MPQTCHVLGLPSSAVSYSAAPKALIEVDSLAAHEWMAEFDKDVIYLLFRPLSTWVYELALGFLHSDLGFPTAISKWGSFV